MTDWEVLQTLERCKQEILQMRATIEHLRPKAEAYDSIVTILRLLPGQGIATSEDMVWLLDKRIRELTPKPAANEQPAPQE